MPATLDDLITAILDPEKQSQGGESSVVHAHCRQMDLWAVRQGLDFYPLQDNEQRTRKQFIDSIFNYNRLALYLKKIVHLFLCTGGVLWYLRPTKNTYEIHWFDKTQYKVIYKPGGREIEEVIIRYSYQDNSASMPAPGLASLTRERWIRLRVRADFIIEERAWQKPSLEPDHITLNAGNGMPTMFAQEKSVVRNTLGFIPCVESPNNPMRPGDSGASEFEWLRNQIESENAMREGMKNNVIMFNNPTLVTTRPKGQVLESMDELGASSQYGPRMSWSGQQGYRDSFSKQGSSRWGQQFGGAGGNARVARIIGGVQPDERFGYIFPDPINGDQWRYVDEYRGALHEALGGIDPMGLKSGMTFGEVKSLYGKVAATAGDKCKSLWTFGLAKVFELAIFAEEKLFLQSYREYLVGTGIFKLKEGESPEMIPESLVAQHFQQQESIPPGVIGLPPFGDRSVLWRHTGPVFEDSPRDKVDLSIGVRNYQELGMGSLQSMEYLFPEKTEKERKQMLSGVPFRYVSSVSGSLNQLLGLQQQMLQTPDPQNPNVPLGARLDLTPLIQQILSSLSQEMSYGSDFNSADPVNEPRIDREYNDPYTDGAEPYPGNATSASPVLLPNSEYAGSTTSGTSPTVQPGAQLPYGTSTSSGIAAGLPGRYELPGYPARGVQSNAASSGSGGSGSADFRATLPVPGGTVRAGSASSTPVPTFVPPGIPTDLYLTPGLLAQLFPAAADQLQRNASSNSKRGSKRSTARNSK